MSNKIRVADYIANFLHDNGIDTAFQVSGGGMMFLLDGIGRHESIKVVCNHHEQASAMAAVTYAKLNKNGLGACFLTTGCGGTNAITGLLNAYQDNISCFFFSGQAKISQTTALAKSKLRQFGVQEADIIPVVESISKYSVMITDVKKVKYHLQKALFLAKSGRPGPVWIDVPLDIQGSYINPDEDENFNPEKEGLKSKEVDCKTQLDNLVELFKKSKRPVILAGQGVRLSDSISQFQQLIEKHKIPFVGTYLAADYVEFKNPLFTGVIGVKGTRSGNFAMQNADLLLVLGSRLTVSCSGYDYDQFAREAKVIVVDIDKEEHSKDTIKIDDLINIDLRQFFKEFKIEDYKVDQDWLNICKNWKDKYPVCLEEYKDCKEVNQYYFMDVLSKNMSDNSIVISDAGSAFYVASQAIKVRKQQRYITSGAQAEMGYTLPAVIGAYYGDKNKDIIGITGEGSLQMNIQEIQTIVHEQLPIKIFIWNNGGYLSIKASQDKFFKGFYVGVDNNSGISFPDLKKLCDAYGINFLRVEGTKDLEDGIKSTLNFKGPMICEVMCEKDQLVIPTLSSYKNEEGKIESKPLEDLFPFLDRDEFNNNMIIKPIN